MATDLKIGDRVGLTAEFVKYAVPFERQHEMASLRGSIIAFEGESLVRVKWDEPNTERLYNIKNICIIKSVAFRESSGLGSTIS